MYRRARIPDTEWISQIFRELGGFFFGGFSIEATIIFSQNSCKLFLVCLCWYAELVTAWNILWH